MEIITLYFLTLKVNGAVTDNLPAWFQPYFWPAASMQLQVMSQGQSNLVTSTFSSESPEVICCLICSPFNVQLVASLWGSVFRVHFCKSTSAKSLYLHQSMLRTTFFSEYYISGADK